MPNPRRPPLRFPGPRQRHRRPLVRAASGARWARVRSSPSAAAESNTNYAQGGIAAVLEPTDSFEAHVAGHAGRRRGPVPRGRRARDRARGARRGSASCVELGVQFDRERRAPGSTSAARAATRARRIVHAGDITGREIERALVDAARADAAHHGLRERTWPSTSCAREVRRRPTPASAPTCSTARTRRGRDRSSRRATRARHRRRRQGLPLHHQPRRRDRRRRGHGLPRGRRDRQHGVHPVPPDLPLPPAGQELPHLARRCAARAACSSCATATRFMERYHADGALAPRDIVARAIDAELKRTGDDCVFLDMTHLGATFLVERFPNIYADMPAASASTWREQPIPVVPAAHYRCGGVRHRRPAGRTTVPGLYAIGEVALHRPARRQPPRLELAARRAGLRRTAPPSDVASSRRSRRRAVHGRAVGPGHAPSTPTRRSSSPRTGTRSAA